MLHCHYYNISVHKRLSLDTISITMNVNVFRNTAPCSLVEIDLSFTYSWGDEYQALRTSETSVNLYETTRATFQKTVIFTLVTLATFIILLYVSGC
jgi:hypothetical protein